jgi:predicted oxidoreductase
MAKMVFGDVRLKEIVSACDIDLTREEWYHLYLSAGQSLQ